jgi:hypothetical protein
MAATGAALTWFEIERWHQLKKFRYRSPLN